VAAFPDEQKRLLFLGFQLGMPYSDHASERLSRKAQRLDRRERRGRLIDATLRTLLDLAFPRIFSRVSN
jgi:hypothetical protein